LPSRYIPSGLEDNQRLGGILGALVPIMAIAPKLVTLLREVSAEIGEAKRIVRVIPTLAWSEQVEHAFFARGAKELPKPSYNVPANVPEAQTKFQELARRLTGDNEIERFLRETCVALETAARMLVSIGSRDFYHHSVELYGRPGSLSSDKHTTNLDLARHFEQVVAGYAPPLSADDQPTLHAEEAAEILRERLSAYFAQHAIKVRVVDHLAAAASSTSAEVRLRNDSKFSRRDLRQIECHEGHVHLATTLNGRAQPVVSFIGSLSPRASRSQEGLAVFTEFITGAASLPRIRRLCDRTLAIHMAEQGANFIEIYRFFLERGNDEHTSFDCARRVMRGGLVEGGAPFTKDGCYLDGLLRVTNFLRIALVKGQSQLVRMLFVGKLAVDDTPLFDRLAREGLVREPIYLPPWAKDLSFLTAFMSYAAFLGRSDLGAEERRLSDRMARADASMS
jgi:uncharacterized protein (TIGR02421 family)